MNISDEFFNSGKKKYLICSVCRGIFIERLHLPDAGAEVARYKKHINDVNDKGYQKFVYPIVDEIIKTFGPLQKGLDFGAGPGPVISKLLEDMDFQIVQYDLFFHNHPEYLDNKYDYIVCCEVIEHFHQPAKEFPLLRNMLAENGKLYCMTSIYNDRIDFKSWWYKNDLTHVFFYQMETLDFIRRRFEFSGLKVHDNLIIFSA